MAAGSTYTPIATTTLGSNQNEISFSSISGSYTDLVLISSVKVTVGATGLRFRINDDTGSNYSETTIQGTGSAAGSDRFSSQSFARIAFYGYPDQNNFGAYITQFQNYSNTTTYKTLLGRSGNAGSGTSAAVGMWRNTAAITSITITAVDANFASGSTFTIYGIKAE